MAAPTLNIALRNNTASSAVRVYISGSAIDSANALVLLRADGRTPYFPASPPAVGAPLEVDCAIPLGAPGSTTNVVVPRISAARIWFALDEPLVFHLNPGPNLVEPSVMNPSDPNINVAWDFVEFTFNKDQLFVNLTYVDFVSVPVAFSLTNAGGKTKHVSGIPAGGLTTVAAGLRAQNALDGAGWDRLVVPVGKSHLRILSPNSGIVTGVSLFSGYFDAYIDRVWAHFAAIPLAVDTQAQWGTVTGQVVTAPNNALSFGSVGSFTRPSAADIFSCSTGPFAIATGAPEMGNIAARLAAAFNRSTLLIHKLEPSGSPADYYLDPVTNHYARLAHAASLDGRGYAFPYDDVGPVNGTDQSGSLSDPAPSLLTVFIGGDTTNGPTQNPGPGSGPSPSPLSAFGLIAASSSTSRNGTQTQPTSDVGGGLNVGWIHNGCWLGFHGIDFGTTGSKQFWLRLASGAAPGVSGLVNIAIDAPTSSLAGNIAIGSTGGWQTWTTVPGVLSAVVTGVHDVYLTFPSGQPADYVNVNWFTFASPVAAAAAPALVSLAVAPAETLSRAIEPPAAEEKPSIWSRTRAMMRGWKRLFGQG